MCFGTGPTFQRGRFYRVHRNQGQPILSECNRLFAEVDRNARRKRPRLIPLFCYSQLRVISLGFFQDADAGIGVLPEVRKLFCTFWPVSPEIADQHHVRFYRAKIHNESFAVS
jgi:hypothetical protein